MRIRTTLLTAALSLLAAAPAADAATKTVNFDDQPANTTVTNQYASSGVTFDQPTDPGYAPVIQTAPNARSGGQVANIDVPNCGTCEFPPPGDTRGQVVGTTASSISVYVGYIGPLKSVGPRPTAPMRLIAYKADGTEVGRAEATVSRGLSFKQLEVDSPAGLIKYFDVVDYGDNDTGKEVAIDDLAIGTPDAPPPPDFTLSPGTGVLDVVQGQSLDDPLTISRVNGSSGDVTFSVSGLPTGMTGTFSPNPVTGTNTQTTLTVTAAPGAAAATNYSDVTITATPSPTAGSGPRTTHTIARISENCSKTVRFDYVDLRDDGCLRKQGTSQFVALNTDVRVNGLVLHPLDGDHVLMIDPVAKVIKSDLGSTYSVAVQGAENAPFYYGPISWNFTQDYTGPQPLGQDPLGKPKKVEGIDISGNPFLKGIPLTGIDVTFSKSGSATVTPTLNLDFFPFNYFGALTVKAAFKTDNDHGASFGNLEIKVPQINALALQLKDIDIKYTNGNSWSGSAKAVLNFEKKLTVGAGFGIKDGHFDFLRGSVSGINTAIGTGVFLQSLGFEVDTNPLKLTGTIGLSAGPAVAGKTAVSFDGGVTAVLSDPWIVEVDGNAKLGGKFEIGSAFLRYSSFGLFEFGGHVHWSLDVVYVDGQVSGWVAGLHNWDVEGSVSGCISVAIFPDPCASAKALVSNLGIAACVEVYGYGVGVGTHWGDDFDAFTGCDLGPWRPVRPTAKAAATGQSFTVDKGVPQVAWALDGTGDAPPDVTVEGPDGTKIELTPSSHYVKTRKYVAAETDNGRTYVIVDKPAAGKWTITPTGASGIAAVRQATGLPKPNVHANVTGKGRARSLTWSLQPIAGQVVRFVEVGKDVRHVIAPTKRARGVAHFKPAAGPAGRRRIVAVIEQDNRPRTTLNVASYRAPGTPKPAKVRALKLTRKKTTIAVSWLRETTGFRHAVYLQLADGTRVLKFVAAGRHSVSFAGVPRAMAVKAAVTGLTSGNTKGPVARRSLKANKSK